MLIHVGEHHAIERTVVEWDFVAPSVLDLGPHCRVDGLADFWVDSMPAQIDARRKKVDQFPGLTPQIESLGRPSMKVRSDQALNALCEDPIASIPLLRGLK